MNKAFYLFIAEQRGLDSSALRRLTREELSKMFKKITNAEMQKYKTHVDKMNKSPLMKLTVSKLQRLMDDLGLSYYGLSKIEMVEAIESYESSSDEESYSDEEIEVIKIVRKKVSRLGIR